MFTERKRIILQAAILDYSETAFHSHPFLKISLEITSGSVLLLVKLLLTVQSSDYRPK